MSKPMTKDPIPKTSQLRKELQVEIDRLASAIENANKTVKLARSAVAELCSAEDRHSSKFH
jgi:hypothetical protein